MKRKESRKSVKSQGNMSANYFNFGILMGPSDYAELFETVDGQPIDIGYFVTLCGEKIRKATSSDDYILGVTSATPGILGNCNSFQWHGKYLKDEWGRVKYREVKIPRVRNINGKIITFEQIERQPILNPAWDPAREYTPRLSRPEWVAVGLLGKILVRDDGTCKVDGYCSSDDNGIATASNKGYRVLKRTGTNQIMIMFR